MENMHTDVRVKRVEVFLIPSPLPYRNSGNNILILPGVSQFSRFISGSQLENSLVMKVRGFVSNLHFIHFNNST